MTRSGKKKKADSRASSAAAKPPPAKPATKAPAGKAPAVTAMPAPPRMVTPKAAPASGSGAKAAAASAPKPPPKPQKKPGNQAAGQKRDRPESDDDVVEILDGKKPPAGPAVPAAGGAPAAAPSGPGNAKADIVVTPAKIDEILGAIPAAADAPTTVEGRTRVTEKVQAATRGAPIAAIMLVCRLLDYAMGTAKATTISLEHGAEAERARTAEVNQLRADNAKLSARVKELSDGTGDGGGGGIFRDWRDKDVATLFLLVTSLLSFTDGKISTSNVRILGHIRTEDTHVRRGDLPVGEQTNKASCCILTNVFASDSLASSGKQKFFVFLPIHRHRSE